MSPSETQAGAAHGLLGGTAAGEPSTVMMARTADLLAASDEPSWRVVELSSKSVRHARSHTRALLAGDDPDVVADVVQVVSELVGNAAEHTPEDYVVPDDASPVILLSVQVEARWVLVGVGDPWPDLPIKELRVAKDDERGRGLAIVDELCSSRWTDVRESGKTVYALIVRPGCELSDEERERLHRS